MLDVLRSLGQVLVCKKISRILTKEKFRVLVDYSCVEGVEVLAAKCNDLEPPPFGSSFKSPKPTKAPPASLI